MSLVIAFILIIVFAGILFGDKSNEITYQQEKSKRDAELANWEAQFLDENLERKIWNYALNPKNYEAVRSEINSVLSETKYWKDLIPDNDKEINNPYLSPELRERKQREFIRKNGRIVLDIMMANRGKITSSARLHGYKAYQIGGNDFLAKKYYEYADTILNLLKKRGAQVTLMYSPSRNYYMWKGTFQCSIHETPRAFNKRLIEYEDVVIPPIMEECKKEEER